MYIIITDTIYHMFIIIQLDIILYISTLQHKHIKIINRKIENKIYKKYTQSIIT